MARESMRNKIVKAVETLVKDTPVSKLTVGQISAAAGVSRQTFYYHFENIPAIYKWALKSKISHERRSAGAISSFVQALDQWFRALEKNKILTLAFLTSSYALDLFDFIRGELQDIAKASISSWAPEGLPEEKLNIAATFAVSANLGIMRDWIVESMETSLETIYESIDELLKTVLSPSILEVIETETGLR